LALDFDIVYVSWDPSREELCQFHDE